MKRVCKLVGCYLLYALLSLGPAIVVIVLDWDVYTATPQRCFSLSVAGMAAVAVVALHLAGHTPKHVRRVVWYALASALLWALRPIISSLAMLFTALTAGELAAMLLAEPLLKRLKAQTVREDLSLAIRQGLTDSDVGKGRV